MRTMYRILYRAGFTPWDTSAIPASLADAVQGPDALPAGRAVDLGCGTGHQARYLAAHGWAVTAVDAALEALALAAARAPESPTSPQNPRPRIEWRRADVTDPRQVDPDGRLAGTVRLLLDDGCLHGIPDARRPGWAATVRTLAAPGCLLLVRAAPRWHRGVGPMGLAADELPALLGADWNPTPRPAADWYRYLRR